MLNKTILEYVWLGANQELRSKIKVSHKHINTIKDISKWSFDGSSTEQAPGDKSDCILKPVKMYPSPFFDDSYLVMCEVEDHVTNIRKDIRNDASAIWFGFEQEYVIYKDGRVLGWPEEGEPGPQGPYYCGVGTENVAGRWFADEHLKLCISANINITGTNAEVMVGQWEYQVLSFGAKAAGDDVWMSRYILRRLSEKYGYIINLEPKPVKGDWNGSGLHVNFSTPSMRSGATKETFDNIIDKLAKRHEDHIAVYGKDNDQRLTGKHETASIDEFTAGPSDRGASIRIPLAVIESDWTGGYLEDRRPASNANPYDITKVILDTIDYKLN